MFLPFKWSSPGPSEITELQKSVDTYGIPVVFTIWLVSGIRDKKVKGAWYIQLVKMHIE